MGLSIPKKATLTFAAGLLLLAAGGVDSALAEGSGRAVRLRTVRVVVDGALSPRTVREALSLDRGDPLEGDALADALDSLAARLRQQPGTPFATLDTWAIEPVGAERADLRLWISSGPYVLVDSVTVSGAPRGSERRFREEMRTHRGQPFDATLWAEDLRTALNALHELGHPFARVTSHPLELASRGDTVGVVAGMSLMPGRRVTVARIELAGLRRTDPQLLQPILAMPDGNLYSPRELAAVQRRLLGTGLFTDVQAAELFRDREGQFGCLYRVEEVPVGEASGALGYAPVEEGGGLAGSLNLRLVNLFGGGRSLAANWQRDSEFLASYRLAYHQPWLFRTPLSVSGEIEQEVLDSSWVARQARLELALSGVNGWAVRGGVVVRSVRADSFAVLTDTLEYDMTGLEGAVELDTRDHPLTPRHGGTYNAWAEVHFGRGEGPELLRRSGLDLTQYLPLAGQLSVMAGLHALDVRAEGGELPSAEWARIGGAATVRGYSERSLAASRAGWANLELRRSMGGGSFLFLLTDAAVLGGVGSIDWKTSLGFGAQIGNASSTALQVAFAVPNGEGLSAGVVHLIARSAF